MELSAATAEIYLRHAFDQMVAVAIRVGDPGINERPVGTDTNTIASLICHCCGVCEFWLGHVALGRPSTRDRDGEFGYRGTVAELRTLVEHALDQARADLAALAAGRGGDAGGRVFLPGEDTSDASVVLHVLEEAFQHLGHVELTADVLLDRRSGTAQTG